ncbi:unnamed protein product [Lactuca saligna]|uniref:Cytochrome P450 n=1 Tax=Lactuca saligna TaxID=75948 RepID=A0AA35YXF1_LACSI|nr:unnamed protein product [Lactuca saligna]
MDLHSLQHNCTFLLGLGAVVVVLHFLLFFRKTGKKNAAPKANGAWPIVGHLNLFGGSSGPTHIALGMESMALKHGPIFTVRLGIHKVLVVNTWEIAKELFTTRDVTISSRPKFTAAKILGYNYAMFGVTPYGPYWREMRKIASLQLLSSRRLEQLKDVHVSELENSIRNLHELWKEKRDANGKVLVDMKKWFGEFDMNVMLRMVVGKRCTEAKNVEEENDMNKYGEVFREFFHFLGLFVVGDALPFLGLLDLGGHVKAMKRVAKEIDFITGKWFDEQRRKRGSAEVVEDKDYMDVMISAVETGGLTDYDADAVIKSTCLIDEIDKHVGKGRRINDSDISKLVYLQAIVKESLRLYPAAPLGAPREFSEDSNVAGYHVPKGTWLIVNIWKIQHDPEIWSDPSEFRPERFLSGTHAHADVRGTNFELIPFGAGRRSCSGLAFSLQILHIVLATLLQNFDMSSPKDSTIDMTESVGLINATLMFKSSHVWHLIIGE